MRDWGRVPGWGVRKGGREGGGRRGERREKVEGRK